MCGLVGLQGSRRPRTPLAVHGELRTVGVQRHLHLGDLLLLRRQVGRHHGSGRRRRRRSGHWSRRRRRWRARRRTGGQAHDCEQTDSECEFTCVHLGSLWGDLTGGRIGPRTDSEARCSAVALLRKRGYRLSHMQQENTMVREELIFVGTCDIAGHVRGKGFPASDLERRRSKGVGWTHSNLMQTAFGPILDTPFGTGGDLMIVPDAAAEVRVDFGDGSAPEHFFLGDIRNTDGSAWECCPREFLRRAIATLDDVSGLRLTAAFEQEFVYTGNQQRDGDSYSLGAFRRQGTFGESFVAAMRTAGVTPDSFLPEYGARQFEVTVAPNAALTAADQAVITREMARAAAHRLGHRASFTPMPEASGVGNGVHVHMSRQAASGAPVTYAPTGPMGLSMAAQHFCAGVLGDLPAICAVAAPW